MATEEERAMIIDLRTKLEMRTLFLRCAISLNIALISGFWFFLLNHIF